MKKHTPGKMIPMLNVRNISKSLDFYQQALGFELVSSVEDLAQYRWGIIGCEGTEFMLSESQHSPLEPPADPLSNGSWAVNFYFYPTDIRNLHKHLTDLHLSDHQFSPSELLETDYGMLEFSLQDPDGHLLSFGAEIQ